MTHGRISAVTIAAVFAATVFATGAAPAQPRQAQPPAAQKPATPAQRPPKRQHVVTKLDGFNLAESGTLDTRTTVAGASRGAAVPLPIAPELGLAFDPRPTLTWAFDAPSGTTFTVRVYNEDEEQVHEATVAEKRYAYRGPVLHSGQTYYWTVEAAGLPDTRSPMVGLKIASAADHAAIAQDLPGSPAADADAHLARARVFVKHRVWYDAIAACDAAIAAAPGAADAHELKAQLLGQFPALESLSREEFARADAASR